jgi:hypothetical protein
VVEDNLRAIVEWAFGLPESTGVLILVMGLLLFFAYKIVRFVVPHITKTVSGLIETLNLATAASKENSAALTRTMEAHTSKLTALEIRLRDDETATRELQEATEELTETVNRINADAEHGFSRITQEIERLERALVTRHADISSSLKEGFGKIIAELLIIRGNVNGHSHDDESSSEPR